VPFWADAGCAMVNTNKSAADESRAQAIMGSFIEHAPNSD
jgi:hypothetical protein